MSEEQVAEALWHYEHLRDGALEPGAARRGELAQVIPRRGVGGAAEIAVEGAVEEEEFIRIGRRMPPTDSASFTQSHRSPTAAVHRP